jgi:rhodanese-related sulfurtransferase
MQSGTEIHMFSKKRSHMFRTHDFVVIECFHPLVENIAQYIFSKAGLYATVKNEKLTIEVPSFLFHILNDFLVTSILRFTKYHIYEDHQGPFSQSYWIIKDSILASRLPTPEDPIQCFDIVVNLLGTPVEYSHKNVINLPIKSREIASDDETMALVNRLIQEHHQKKTILVHCKHGIGRTGVIVALLVSHIFHFNYEDTLKYLEICYQDTSMRKRKIPSSKMQREQVRRLCWAEERNETRKLKE